MVNWVVFFLLPKYSLFIMNFFLNNRNKSKTEYVRNNKKGNVKHERTIEILNSVHNLSNSLTRITNTTGIIQV